jgi:hypothetical protein
LEHQPDEYIQDIWFKGADQVCEVVDWQYEQADNTV